MATGSTSSEELFAERLLAGWLEGVRGAAGPAACGFPGLRRWHWGLALEEDGWSVHRASQPLDDPELLTFRLPRPLPPAAPHSTLPGRPPRADAGRSWSSVAPDSLAARYFEIIEGAPRDRLPPAALAGPAQELWTVPLPAARVLFTRGSSPDDDYGFQEADADLPDWAAIARCVEGLGLLFDDVDQRARLSFELGQRWLVAGIERTERRDHVGRPIVEIAALLLPASLARATGAWCWGLGLEQAPWRQWITGSADLPARIRLEPRPRARTAFLQGCLEGARAAEGWATGVPAASLNLLPALAHLRAIAERGRQSRRDLLLARLRRLVWGGSG